MGSPSLSLVIPCYNEQNNLPKLISRCEEVFSGTGVEVILVDNGSTDDTPKILPELATASEVCRTVRVEVNQGYGFGILSGLAVCQGDFFGWTHADLQTDPADVLAALDIIEAHQGDERLYIKGRRYNRPVIDTAFAWGMALFEFLVLGIAMWDINAQPNIFHRQFYKSWQDPPHDFSLDLFAYAIAVKRRMNLKRIPVYFPPRKAGVGSNDSLPSKISFSIRALRFSLAIRRRLC